MATASLNCVQGNVRNYVKEFTPTDLGLSAVDTFAAQNTIYTGNKIPVHGFNMFCWTLINVTVGGPTTTALALKLELYSMDGSTLMSTAVGSGATAGMAVATAIDGVTNGIIVLSNWGPSSTTKYVGPLAATVTQTDTQGLSCPCFIKPHIVITTAHTGGTSGNTSLWLRCSNM